MIIPLFLLNRGCPHRCIYCNTRQIAGKLEEPLTEDYIKQTVARCSETRKRRDDLVELAFYGGNFTGMEEPEQVRLLAITDTLIRDGLIHQVRIANRPDDLSPRAIDLLAQHRVATIEIGAQSLVDDVLTSSRRGHTAEDVITAVRLAREYGFTVGIHLMAGLPGDNDEKFAETIRKTISLKPDMVRLHPTLVFADTPLAEMFAAGEYTPLNLGAAVHLSRYALVQFERARIPLIRLGLQTTELMQAPGSLIAGPFHPAFRALVEASLFRDMAAQLLRRVNRAEASATFHVNPRDVSSFRGDRNDNIRKLQEQFDLTALTVHADPRQERGGIALSLGPCNKFLMLKRTDPV